MTSRVAHIPLDLKVWQLWLDKNHTRERAAHVRRANLTLALSPLALAAVLVWLFLGR